jgi:hypothetical protein
LEPFAGSEAPRPLKWFERLFRLTRPAQAEQALAFLFRTYSPFEIGYSKVTAALEQFGCSGSVARDVARRVWSRALERFLEDNAFSDDEVLYLDRLCRLLDVGFDDSELVIAALVHPRYHKSVKDAAADGVLSDDERRFLEALRSKLRLEPEVAGALRQSALQEVVTSKVSEAVEDRRLTPDELESIERLKSGLGVDLHFDDESKRRMERFAKLWRIENGNLPDVDAPISLKEDERCHFQATCTWLELRTQTSRVDYHGPVGSIKIAKGLRYRIGSIALQRITTEELVPLDEGTVYFTSQRILFSGAKRNMSIQLPALIGIHAFSNAVVLEKASGRSPHLVFDDADLEYACVILSALLAQV